MRVNLNERKATSNDLDARSFYDPNFVPNPIISHKTYAVVPCF